MDWSMSASLLQRAKMNGNPVVDGNSATFVWRGERAPLLVADFSGWSPDQAIEMEPVEPNAWIYQVELPPDAYIEYAFISPEDPELRLPDPLNRRRTSTGMGKFNHYFYMPAGKATPWVKKQPEVSSGKITRHRLQTDGLVRGKLRNVYLYSPACCQGEAQTGGQPPVPLLVVFDGREYLKRARLPTIVDNLIAHRRIRPLALALVENGGSSRFMEYACAESTLIFLREMVLPMAREDLNLLDIDQQPGAFGVMGASMGGLMAVYSALRLPEIFGKVISQSGAFALGGRDTVVFDLVNSGDKPPIRFWLDAGNYDHPVLLTANRRFYPALVERGYRAVYREYPGGHNYPAWRDDLPAGLEFAFGVQ